MRTPWLSSSGRCAGERKRSIVKRTQMIYDQNDQNDTDCMYMPMFAYYWLCSVLAVFLSFLISINHSFMKREGRHGVTTPVSQRLSPHSRIFHRGEETPRVGGGVHAQGRERERERGREGGGGKRLRYLRRNGMKCMQTKRVSFLFHDINPISSLFDTIQMCDPKTHPPPLGRWGGGEVGRTQPSRSSRPPRFWGRAPRRPRRPPYRACLPCRACRRACRLACRRARPRHPRLRPGTSC